METTPLNTSKTIELTKTSDLRTKLDEINTIDTAHLTVLEKKKLRRDISYLKERIKKLSGGIYIAIAKLLVITLLLYFILSVLG